MKNKEADEKYYRLAKPDKDAKAMGQRKGGL